MPYFNARETASISLASDVIDNIVNQLGNGYYRFADMHSVAEKEARDLDRAFDQRGKQPMTRALSSMVQFFARGFEQGAELDTDDALEMLAGMPAWSAGAMMEGALCRKRADGGRQHGFANLAITVRQRADDCAEAERTADERFSK